MQTPEAVFPSFKLRTAFDSVAITLDTNETACFFPVFRTSIIALLVAIGYYAGSQIGFFLTPSDRPISTFWPPNAILLAVFLLTPLRIWWVLLLAVLPAHLLVQLKTGIPVVTSLGWFVGNTGEALLGAVCIRLFKKEKSLFESVQGVVVFLAFGVLLAPLATSFLDAESAIRIGHGSDYWTLWAIRFTTNTVSILSIVPITGILGVRGTALFRGASLGQYFEAAVLAVGMMAFSLLAFSRQTAPDSISQAFIYIPLLLMVWGALRFGAGGMSVLMLCIALISGWNAMQGRGPFGPASATDQVLSLHILLTIFALPLMLTAALVAERGRDAKTLQASSHNLIYLREQGDHRIARKLHTDIAGRLMLVGLKIDRFRGESDASVRPNFDELHDEISRVCKETIDLSHEVHPFMVEYLGLAGALKKLCGETGAQSAVTISFSAENVPRSLPSEVANRLFRVAKEALRNVTQFSQAKTANVELKAIEGHVLLRISDDDIGIASQQGEGLGLTYMREQTLSLGGTFKQWSLPSKGTAIEVSMPISQRMSLAHGPLSTPGESAYGASGG
jgi:signal transduction histidine kinase